MFLLKNANKLSLEEKEIYGKKHYLMMTSYKLELVLVLFLLELISDMILKDLEQMKVH